MSGPDPIQDAPDLFDDDSVAKPAAESEARVKAPRPARKSIFRDPVVRWMSFVAFGLVVLYLVTIVSAMLMGVLGSTEPKTMAERNVQYYGALARSTPKVSETWGKYISALIAAKQYAKAQQMIDLATKTADQASSQDILSQQAVLYYATGKYDLAIKTADQVRANLKAYYDKAKEKSNSDEAKGQQINDNNWGVLIIKAEAQVKKKDINGAIATMDIYLKANPTAADMQIYRGNLRLDAGDKAGAESDFRAAMKYLPNDPQALEGLKKIGASK
jgi:tetratricopeptide (TPR) repeat protein